MAAQDFGIFGVNLYPYAITQLFQLPTSEISNQSPDLYALYGKDHFDSIILAVDNPEHVDPLFAQLVG